MDFNNATEVLSLMLTTTLVYITSTDTTLTITVVYITSTLEISTNNTTI